MRRSLSLGGIYISFLLSLALPLQSLAQEFVVQTVDGPVGPAPLGNVGLDWSVRLSGNKPHVIAGNNVISLRRAGAHLPDWPRQDVLLLTGGDRIPIDPAGPFAIEDDHLLACPDFRLPLARRSLVRVPLPYVAAIVLGSVEGDHDPDLTLARLRSGKRQADLLLLKNGDRIEGKLKDVAGERGFWLDVEGRKVENTFSHTAILALATAFQARPRAKKPHALVVLEGGGRILFADLRHDAESKLFAGKTLAGFDAEIPVGQIAAIDIRQGRAVYLSDLTPKSYEHTPFLSLTWPLARDHGVTGLPLRVGKDTFDKGLGMHATSRVTYTLGGAYRWFEATVGLDSRTAKRGQARVSVLVDGKAHEACATKELTAVTAPLVLRIDLRKARELTLITDMGKLGDVQARVNWAEARLVHE